MFSINILKINIRSRIEWFPKFLIPKASLTFSTSSTKSGEERKCGGDTCVCLALPHYAKVSSRRASSLQYSKYLCSSIDIVVFIQLCSKTHRVIRQQLFPLRCQPYQWRICEMRQECDGEWFNSGNFGEYTRKGYSTRVWMEDFHSNSRSITFSPFIVSRLQNISIKHFLDWYFSL